MADVTSFLDEHRGRLVQFRRDLHAHPELARQEFRTTARIADLLAGAGLHPRVLSGGTGLICDIGAGPPTLGLRADIDALPLADGKSVDYRSTVPDVCHACGHDVHATVVLGVGLLLARHAAAGQPARSVRLIFQPAEEVIPGGALDLIAAGALDGLERLFALHCDPTVEVGHVGLRVGPITAAADVIEVRVGGPGGHTARPYRTADVVAAIGDVVARSPGVFGKRVDPRSGATLAWGSVHAGNAANVIPQAAVARGTLRVLDRATWESAPALLDQTIREIAAPYGVSVEVDHERGVPPVVNDGLAVAELAAAAATLGADTAQQAEQSLGGEDFGWCLEKVPGALARLGVRTPGAAAVDLHQPLFDVDERSLDVGIRLLAAVALREPGSAG